MRLIITWFINAAALFVIPYLMKSVRIDSFGVALVAALVLGFVNTFIRWILVVLTFPITLVTLGLFIFVINGFLFWLVANFVKGFYVASFWPAVGAAILYSIISWMLSSIILNR